MQNDSANDIPQAEQDEAIAEYLASLSQECDARSLERHNEGAAEYGPLGFLQADTIEMALEEILDLMNYARYTYIKLRILQDNAGKIVKTGENK